MFFLQKNENREYSMQKTTFFAPNEKKTEKHLAVTRKTHTFALAIQK